MQRRERSTKVTLPLGIRNEIKYLNDIVLIKMVLKEFHFPRKIFLINISFITFGHQFQRAPTKNCELLTQ